MWTTYQFALSAIPLPQESEEHVDGAAGDIVKDPDEHADHDDAGDDDQRVVDGLLTGGPLDLLQLALHILQPLILQHVPFYSSSLTSNALK